MKKWVYTASIAVILGVLSVAYYITGVRAEKEFNRFLESSENLSNVTITADNYHRGWLKSTVHINAVVHQPEQEYTEDDTVKILPAQDISFSFDTDIYHGPIILANHHIFLGLGYAQAKIPLPNEALNQFNNMFTQNSVQPNFIVSLLLKYRSRLDVGFDIPPFELTSKNGENELNWKGFTSHWKLWRKAGHTKGYMTFEGASFKNNDFHGEIETSHFKYDVENTHSQILSGEASLDLKSIQFDSNNQLPVKIDGFQAVSYNHVKDNLVDSSLKADVSKVAFNGVDYGPGVLDVATRHLDATALNQIQEQLQAVNSSNLTDAQQQVLLLTILPELPALVEKGAEFEVKQFQLSVPYGLILATAKIKLPIQEKANQNPLQLINQLQATASAEVPVLWLNEVTADILRFKIEQRQLMQQEIALNNKNGSLTSHSDFQLLSTQEIDALAEKQANEQLVNLVENNLLIKKDNIYSIEMTFKNGAFTVNGKPFNSNVIQ